MSKENKKNENEIDSDALASLFYERNITKLGNVEFMLWISWLDQRTGFREFRIVAVEDDFKVLCTYGIRLIVNGREFINSISALELADKFFVSTDSATKEDWKTFIERILENEKPRVIPNYSFRKRLAMPESASMFEVYVLSAEVRDNE